MALTTMQDEAIGGVEREVPAVSREAVFDRRLAQVTGVAIVVLLSAMVVVIWLSVFFRYVLDDPIAWGEQVAKYLMIWGAFLGAGLGVREGSHIAVELLVLMLPSRVRQWCSTLVFLLVGGFLAVTIFYGGYFAYKVRHHHDPLVAELSMAVPYAAIPIGSALMLVQLVLGYRRSLRGEGGAPETRS